MTIAANAPGVFTSDGSGAGQAAAINTSAATGAVTLNSATSPAKIGDTVSLYLTGEGNYNAALPDGRRHHQHGLRRPGRAIRHSRRLAPLPTVQIGGVDASAGVSYAGVVPVPSSAFCRSMSWFRLGSSTGAAVPVLDQYRRQTARNRTSPSTFTPSARQLTRMALQRIMAECGHWP